MKVNNKIRVMQLGSPEGLYGAERWILALVKHLNHDIIESWVAAIKDDHGCQAPLCTEAEKIGAKVKVFEAFGRANVQVVGQLRQFIREHEIQILHTHFYKTDLLGLLAVQGTACKIISTPHGWSQEGDFKLWCYEMMDRFIFPFFHRVVPLSEELLRPLAKIPGVKKKLKYIRNGVDISEIEAVKDLAPEIMAWRDEGAFVLGYIGQLIGRKGLDLVLREVATLPPALNWRLAIVGEGEKREELTSYARELGVLDRVSFFGFRPDRLAFLKGFDAFVLASQLEGIPRCLMEAMAAGVNVIASDIPGCNDLIVHGQTGLLFPLDRPEKLAEAIIDLAADGSLQTKLRSNGQDLVLEKFSATRMAKEYEQLFVELAS